MEINSSKRSPAKVEAMEDVPKVEHEAESDDDVPEWAETVHQKAVGPRLVSEVKAPRRAPAVNVIQTYDPDAPKPVTLLA